MVMKIENYSGSANTFTWPNNPNTFDDQITANYSVINVGYQRYHVFTSGGGVAPKTIVLSGHFFGSSKNTNYETLSRHFMENNQLKKLYFASDRFYLGVGKEIKKTHTGGRTNFLDYVATYETIVGVLFSDTQQTFTEGGADKTNGGNVNTFIEEIAGTVTSGASPITITDNLGNTLTIPASSLTTGQAVVIKFVEMVSDGSGTFTTEYNYTTVAGSQIKTTSTGAGLGILQLAAAESISDMTLGAINLDAAYTIKFRNAYSA